MSEFFGAQDRETLRCEIGTSLTAGPGSRWCWRAALRRSGGPAVVDQSAGEPAAIGGTVFANCVRCASVHVFVQSFCQRAARGGDSRTPLFFVAASACANISGGLCVRSGFGHGVEGAALATALAMTFSGVLCVSVWLDRHSAARPGRAQLSPRRIFCAGPSDTAGDGVAASGAVH